MTREQQYWEDTQEALSRIFDRCEEIDPQSGYDMLEDIQFVRGFINKHKPQPEPSEDCISRAKALEVIEEMDIPEDMSVFEIKSHIGVEIGTLPPATPKRKVGEWLKKNNDYFDWYECSECGYGSEGEMKYNRLCDVRTKFCPDCGSQNLKGE